MCKYLGILNCESTSGCFQQGGGLSLGIVKFREVPFTALVPLWHAAQINAARAPPGDTRSFWNGWNSLAGPCPWWSLVGSFQVSPVVWFIERVTQETSRLETQDCTERKITLKIEKSHIFYIFVSNSKRAIFCFLLIIKIHILVFKNIYLQSYVISNYILFIYN